MSGRQKTGRVTVANVARQAGVSTTTVSLILSDRQEYLKQFHPDTISKVRETARSLGYRANLFASGLPTGATSFFGLILRDSGTQAVGTWHQWAFEGELLAGVLQAAAERSLYAIVANAADDLDEDSLGPLERIIAGGVMGTIVRTPSPALEKCLRIQSRHGRPFVIVFPAQLSRWPANAIDVDNVAIGRTAAHLLAAQGRRNWCIVSFRKLRQAHVLRCKGFCQVAQSIGARVEHIQVTPGLDDVGASKAISPRLAELKSDGLFALDSIASVATLLACRDIGLQPGRDYHLVGCDCSMWQSTPLPRITAVDVSWKDVGRTAVLQLLQQARNADTRFPTILLPPRVVPAETCPVHAGECQQALLDGRSFP